MPESTPALSARKLDAFAVACAAVEQARKEAAEVRRTYAALAIFSAR
jgi:hypothetical protein